MLREYFSGVSVESLSRRYGYSVIKIKTLASDYKQGKIDVFDNPQKRKIAESIMTHQEEVCVGEGVSAFCQTMPPSGRQLMSIGASEHRAFVRAKARFAGPNGSETQFCP